LTSKLPSVNFAGAIVDQNLKVVDVHPHGQRFIGCSWDINGEQPRHVHPRKSHWETTLSGYPVYFSPSLCCLDLDDFDIFNKKTPVSRMTSLALRRHRNDHVSRRMAKKGRAGHCTNAPWMAGTTQKYDRLMDVYSPERWRHYQHQMNTQCLHPSKPTINTQWTIFVDPSPPVNPVSAFEFGGQMHRQPCGLSQAGILALLGPRVSWMVGFQATKTAIIVTTICGVDHPNGGFQTHPAVVDQGVLVSWPQVLTNVGLGCQKPSSGLLQPR
jgi:hypothetical protein